MRRFPALVGNAITFVLYYKHTQRTTVESLDNVEKTFVSLKIEHYLRHMLCVPKGIRDLDIDGVDLDVKGTLGRSWMIPPESFGDPCLLVKVNDKEQECSLGLIVARKAYLGAENRDRKRSILSDAFDRILWIVQDLPYQEVY
jgi:Restriction endonuclease NaeI